MVIVNIRFDADMELVSVSRVKLFYWVVWSDYNAVKGGYIILWCVQIIVYRQNKRLCEAYCSVLSEHLHFTALTQSFTQEANTVPSCAACWKAGSARTPTVSLIFCSGKQQLNNIVVAVMTVLIVSQRQWFVTLTDVYYKNNGLCDGFALTVFDVVWRYLLQL